MSAILHVLSKNKNIEKWTLDNDQLIGEFHDHYSRHELEQRKKYIKEQFQKLKVSSGNRVYNDCFVNERS